MKYLNLLLVLLLGTSSCKNIEKMVDKGEYDKAINYAVSKLEGQKNKKTKHVKALERAYAKVNQRDNDQIESLLSQQKDNKYDKVYDLYTAMKHRQQTVMRLDPLVSKDGYVADFGVKDYTTLLVESGNKAASDHYKNAKQLLNVAKSRDKYAAREAYNRLSYIDRYADNYKDSDALKQVAHNLGIDHVGLKLIHNTFDYTLGQLQNVIYDVDIQSLNKFWTKYHINNNSETMDITVTIELNEILAGYEKESINSYIESKEVEDGVKKVKDLNGNIVKDSLGQDVLTKRYKTISAEVTELNRLKAAEIRGKTILFDNNNNSLIRMIPFELTHVFEDYSATFNGDKKALTKETKKRLKTNCGYFPNDYDMVMNMAYPLRDNIYELLKDM